MAAWVTDVPNLDGRATPLQYRFLVAMQGALGIGNNLNKWTNEDFALGAKLTALYKTIPYSQKSRSQTELIGRVLLWVRGRS
jgi:alpha-galactosidase